MIVPSLQFLAFAAIAALLFNLAATRGGWPRLVLLVVNFVFFASFARSPLAVIPFAAFLAIGFVAQRVVRDGAKKWLFPALLIVIVAGFFWLKRYSFVPSTVLMPFPYVLVGLSYVFFRVLHLIIDSHQGVIPERVSPLSYLNYTLNFTALTSGPIQRYQDYRRMEVEPLPLDLVIAGRAIERIVIGYFKVAIVSMLFEQAQHAAIGVLTPDASLPQRIGIGTAIVALYPIYLYMNFSGYTDVVIGVARFFRIALPENFNRPFIAGCFIDFWGRWHITLSSWLKTYVYNPLMLVGMERITAPALAPYVAVAAYFVTFFLVGLWHGQTSEFVFFGFLQGGGVAMNKLYQLLMQNRLGRKRYLDLTRNALYLALARGLTFTWFAFTLLWFWSNWSQMAGFAQALGIEASLCITIAIFGLATVLIAVGEAMRNLLMGIEWREQPIVLSRYLRTSWCTALVVVTAAAIILFASPAPDIVYKGF
ncbi:MAG TPA: MBOAT family O-acyltransferase [Stellaceae bacterium]|nr:MBOAT family O-acyltransferase [Stellaceae bacterium]